MDCYATQIYSSDKFDEAASRDSGHSSGGSPDIRGLRSRRMINKQPEWFSKRQDSNSIYSYETANEDENWQNHLDTWTPPIMLKQQEENIYTNKKTPLKLNDEDFIVHQSDEAANVQKINDTTKKNSFGIMF